MPMVDAGGVQIAYEESGPPSGPPLIMLNGAGLQLVDWTPRFITALEDNGLRTTRIDHRDCGLSTHFSAAGKARLSTGPTPTFTPPYTLGDMAEDVAAVVDGLGARPAHLLGFSLGGAVAQTVAITRPAAVASLTLVASSTGATGVGTPTPEGRKIVMRSLPPDPQAAFDDAVARRRFLASPGDDDGIATRERVSVSMARAWAPAATGRQMAAARAAGDRTEALAGVAVPTLVVHGDLDPVVDPSGGRALHAALAHSRLVTYDGMAHDIPSFLAEPIATEVAAHVHATDQG